MKWSRAWVHAGLVVAVSLSLAYEPVLALHIGFGLAFVGLVAVHLAQRRRTSAALVRRLTRPRAYRSRSTVLAAADLALLILTAAMLLSGFWDVLAAHPSRIRWHAVTGLLLTVFLAIHTVRRRRRLATSTIR